MIKRNNRTILLTGGHAATAAYATVESLKQRNYFKQIFFVGSKTAIEGKDFETLESQILPELGVLTHWIPGGRIQRKFTIWTIPSLLKIPLSFIVAVFLILKIRPWLILSFGGGASFPVVLAGWLLGVPVIIHDQTASAGRANEIASPFARKIILSRASSLDFFPLEKSVVLGNPVRKEIVKIGPKNNTHIKTILITGGSRGSVALNELVQPVLKKLISKYKIIHQVGPIDYEKFAKIKTELSESESGNYEVFPNLDLGQMTNYYKNSDVVVARAGANTVSEILIISRPCVLVPIPWSYKDEQNLNAKYAEDLGLAKIVSQNSDPQDLFNAIVSQVESAHEIKAKYKNFHSLDEKAADKIATLLEEI